MEEKTKSANNQFSILNPSISLWNAIEEGQKVIKHIFPSLVSK